MLTWFGVHERRRDTKDLSLGDDLKAPSPEFVTGSKDTLLLKKLINTCAVFLGANKKKKTLKIRESSDSQLDNKKLTADPLKVKPVVASQKEVIDFVRKDPSGGFLYMVYAVHPENVYFTPYYLKYVDDAFEKRSHFIILRPLYILGLILLQFVFPLYKPEVSLLEIRYIFHRKYLLTHSLKKNIKCIFRKCFIRLGFLFIYRVVPYEDIDRKNYLTISPCGVTHYTNEMVFTKLMAWEQEYTIFVKLTDVMYYPFIFPNVSLELRH